jgi:7,8-dihydropterin-6-yl-methyl-4-(beta-D-ribofuranosyl)aminobenzene 5'-phosphate synthase
MRSIPLAVSVITSHGIHALVLCVTSLATIAAAQPHRVHSLEVKVLSTMLADMDGIGEWGFSALVVADGHRILFDTGARPDTVWNNARELKVDLTSIPDVILSHNHGDHTGGLIKLRRSVLNAGNPAALATTHVGEGIFWKRDVSRQGWEPMDRVRKEYEALGGKMIVYDKPRELYPGIWITGPIDRVYPEKNFGIGPGIKVQMPNGSLVEDTIAEDMSLVIDTDRGLVVLTGCGHAGIINTLQYARARIRAAPFVAVIGGLHLFQLDEEHLKWTAAKLKEFGVENFLGAHCTGVEATYRIRQLCGLSRDTAAVAAVGGGFTLGEGLHPGRISK